MILDYIKTNWIEVVGAVLSLIYLYLSIKEKISLWIFGFLSSAFYIIVFFDAKFYADMSLQFYYLGVSVYGWFYWRNGNLNNDAILETTNIGRKLASKLTLISIPIFFVYYVILAKFTDSPIPISDSIVGMLSIIGTWMLAKKLIENWLIWIAADTLATGLFFYKGLYITAILFIIYTGMAIYGYIQWKKNLIVKIEA